MRLAIMLGLIGVILIAGIAQGVPVVKDAATVGPEDLPRIDVVRTDENGVSLVFELPTLAIDRIPVAGGTFDSIEIPGGGLIGEVGHPALPTFTRLVAIPDDAAVTITAIVESETDLADINLVPMQPDEGEEFAYDEAAYRLDAFGQAPRSSAGSPAISRDLRVVPVTFRPIRYNPEQQTLRVADRMRVDVRFEGQDLRNVRSGGRRSIPPSFHRLYQDLVVNYEEPPRGMSVEPGTYLVICPDDNAIVSRLQPLLDWRERKGQTVVLATTAQTGSTTDAILSYIQAAYDTWDPPLEYVTLVGDATTPYRIRTWHENLSGYYGEGDDPYTKLEGNDVLSDIHIGRLSISNTSDLETIVAKIVGYESDPYMGENWYPRACLSGDPSHSGYSTVIVQQWIKQRLQQIGYAEIDTVFSGNYVTGIRNGINDGVSIFSYRGYYGMSGWGNSNTYALNNTWMLPFVVTITCDTGSFESGTARSEGFLRAGSASSPIGGIGAVGTATIGTHTRFNNCMHYGIFYGLIYENQFNIGAALTRGKYEMYANYHDGAPNYVQIWSHWNNLMGDPAVECWTGRPELMNVEHTSSIPVGATATTVTVDDGVNPLDAALVCLLKEGEIHEVGYTNEMGEVEIPLSGLTSGEMKLTVTKHNRYPYLATIPIVSEDRYVAYLASSVDDDTNGGSLGNGDGRINPGETIELAVQLKNYGILSANGVEAVMTETDPYVTLVTDTQTYGDIPGGGSAWSVGNYVIEVDPACPDDHPLLLGLEIAAGAENWHSLAPLAAVSADLIATGAYTLTNVGGNGLFDPRETGDISVELRNDGGEAATAPSATLLSMSEYVTILDPNGTYGTIDVGGTGENTSDKFTVSVAPECFEGYEAGFKMLLEFTGGARDTTYFTVPIGNRSSNDPTGPDAYGYLAYDNGDTDYPEAPTYEWIEIDPNYGGQGTTIPLSDYNDFQDDSYTVDIPFVFSYYGEEFTRATVCSNGWLSMGTTWLAAYRNWSIPGAGGPDAMIAPFWDDLYMASGTSYVVQYYDQANHRWIVEWSRMRNDYGNYTETFEVILYDPAYHPTETGDGEIVFQYDTVANHDGIDGYATVGIENQDQSIAVLYTYYNVYEPGAASLTSGRAIRFIPTREVLAGTIYGAVRNEYAGGLPVSGATVTVLDNGDEFETGPDGTYLAAEPPGIYSLAASHEGFEPDTVSSVEVAAGGSVEINFDLRDIEPPTIQTTEVATTNDTIGPYPVIATISDPSPLTEKELYYSIDGGEFSALPLVSIGFETYQAEIPGQPWSTRVEYYLRVRDAGDNEATDPPGAPEELFVFYVAPTIDLFVDDMETFHGWQVGEPDDDATGGLWSRVDPNGTFDNGEPVQPEDDHTDDPGAICWVTGNAPPGANQYEADVDGGKTTLLSPRIFLDVEGLVILQYYRWYTNDTGTNPGEDSWVVQITDDDGQSWVDLENTTASNRSWLFKQFDLSEYVSFTDQVRLRFVAEDGFEGSVIEAAIDDVRILFTGFGADRYRG